MIAWRCVASGAPPNMVVPGANVFGSARNALRFASVHEPPLLALSASEYWKSARLAILRPTTPLSDGAVAPALWQPPHASLRAPAPGGAATPGPPTRTNISLTTKRRATARNG